MANAVTEGSLSFQAWVPPAVMEEAKRLYGSVSKESDPAKAAEVLKRLATDSRMKHVWNELQKKKRSQQHGTQEYFYPAQTNSLIAARYRARAEELRRQSRHDNGKKRVYEQEAKLLDAEAAILEQKPDIAAGKLTPQDRALQLVLFHAYHNSLDIKPIMLKDLRKKVCKLRALSADLIGGAKELSSVGMNHDAKLAEEISESCTHEADNVLPSSFSPSPVGQFKPTADDPWVVERRNGGDIFLRTFLADMSISMATIFGTAMYGVIAAIASVVFERHDLTAEKVRDLLRPRSSRSRSNRAGEH